jgi:hypothetical protein
MNILNRHLKGKVKNTNIVVNEIFLKLGVGWEGLQHLSQGLRHSKMG